MARLRILQLGGYDLAMDINRPNHKGFTPLSIVLTTAELVPLGVAETISCLLNFGARFSDVTPLYLDNIQHLSHLPWYPKAQEAYQLSLSRPPQTFDDVSRVYRLLRLLHLPGFSPPVVRLVMDMAEYWAHVKIIRNDIRYTTDYGGMPIPFPEPPNDSGAWTPRRVLFSCKTGVCYRDLLYFLEIRVRLRCHNEIYALPVLLEPRYKTVFDVWDEHTPAKHEDKRERKKLVVTDLKPGDAFDVEFVCLFDDYFEFEFFQIEVYFSIGHGRPQEVGVTTTYTHHQPRIILLHLYAAGRHNKYAHSHFIMQDSML
ncbi:hypothetical protein J3R83DRAFT_13658 [Lanmaoa asiatica]|nr:hypothetical protein J3R83DRAFT_13658 [Lanmaoa asiatica]